ncbi:hypothetical protein WJX72_007508 [[Myrmecia] bisecta]|uniref:Peptidase M20 dimerisation domain-containing protein n=1 Tax=[Myrmecia] bisecta TaxID=41462 RepID=A0AAW1R848_9CHLO
MPGTVHAALWTLSLLAFADQAVGISVDAIKGTDVVRQLKHLATYSDSPAPSVTRLVYTAQDKEARKYIKQLMKDAGLTIREDAIGNTFARWAGADSSQGAVATGSHADSLILGGPYDGCLGVVGGIAAVAGLKAAGFKPQKPIEVIMFTSEEGDRFSHACLGSLIMTNIMSAEFMDKLIDMNGTSFLEAANKAGYHAASNQEFREKVKIKDGSVDAFVELHIEQGPILEDEGYELAVVTHISAPSLLKVNFWGKGGHAGGMPMRDRNDAALAAAELALAVEKAALDTGSLDTVGTSGKWSITPNLFNSIPRASQLDIDIRDIDKDRRDSVVEATKAAAAAVAKKRNVGVSMEFLYNLPPASSAPEIMDAVETAAKAIGASYKKMKSMAYHDAAVMGQITKTGMIFIPSHNGLSHHPDEYSSPEDIERGVRALALTLAQLAGSAEEADSEL